jgi:hypothetical protein
MKAIYKVTIKAMIGDRISTINYHYSSIEKAFRGNYFEPKKFTTIVGDNDNRIEVPATLAIVRNQIKNKGVTVVWLEGETIELGAVVITKIEVR